MHDSFLHTLAHREMLLHAQHHDDSWDLEFVFGKEVVRAHAFVLESRFAESKFFKVALVGKCRRFKATKECPFSARAFLQMLHWFYCGSLSPDVTAEAIRELASACDVAEAVPTPAPLLIELEISLRRLLTVSSMHSLVLLFEAPGPGSGVAVVRLWKVVQVFVFRNWQVFLGNKEALRALGLDALQRLSTAQAEASAHPEAFLALVPAAREAGAALLLLDRYRGVLARALLADCVLVCRDGELGCHRAVLAAAAPSLLQAPVSGVGRVSSPRSSPRAAAASDVRASVNVSVVAGRALLQFVYAGVLPGPLEAAELLLISAAVPGLAAAVQTAMSHATVTADNAAALLVLTYQPETAAAPSIFALRKACLQFICARFVEVDLQPLLAAGEFGKARSDVLFALQRHLRNNQ